MIAIVYGGLVLLTFICVALMTGWLSVSLRRAGLKQNYTFRSVTVILLWLTLTAALAESGALSKWDAIPPRLPLIPLAAFACLIALSRTEFLKKLGSVTPRHWPVGMQTFRIFVELSFWGLYTAGGAPALVTFEGRNFDILVGLTAPLVAFAIYKTDLKPKFVIAWNIFGLLVLSNTIFTLITALPGRLHLPWPGDSFTAFADWPFIWIPALLAPLAIFLHLFSIRQNASMLGQLGTRGKQLRS